MLTQIDVVADEVIQLPIIGASSRNSFILAKVTGLNPPDIALFIGDYARDGGLYGGRRVPNRPVGMRIFPNPNYADHETVASLRRRLYKAFIDPMRKGDTVKLRLHDDLYDKKLMIEAYTEKFEGDVFSDDTGLDIQLLAPNPYIVDELPVVHDDSDLVQGMFIYDGTAETGISIGLTVTANTNAISIGVSRAEPQGTVPVETYLPVDTDVLKLVMGTDSATGFKVDDEIVINTVRGSRSITMKRGVAAPENILGAMTDTSAWLELHDHRFFVTVGKENPMDGVAVANFNPLVYRPTHWGI